MFTFEQSRAIAEAIVGGPIVEDYGVGYIEPIATNTWINGKAYAVSIKCSNGRGVRVFGRDSDGQFYLEVFEEYFDVLHSDDVQPIQELAVSLPIYGYGVGEEVPSPDVVSDIVRCLREAMARIGLEVAQR